MQTAMQAEDDIPISFSDLPPEVVHLLFGHLDLTDLVHAACSCSAWYSCLWAVWQGRCLARWHHWTAPPPAQDAGAAAWRSAYRRRHKVDAEVLQLLTTHAAWPTRKAATYDAILAHGADAVDVLTAAAQAASLSGLFIGLAHQAHMALLVLQGHLAAQHIQTLLAAEAAAQAGTQDAGGPALAATGGASAAGSSAGLPQQPDALSAEGEPPDFVLEVALQLAQSFHPLTDMAAVRGIVAQLGDELAKRMQQAGAQPGSREALTMLNNLLFGDPAATAALGAASSDAAQANQGSPNGPADADSSRHQAAISSGCWSSLWPSDADLHGPDLSTFAIPSDGCSGLGFKGSAEVYSHAGGSCLDSVLSQRTGLPITLAILHRAVGRRVGLDVQLVNMPGHVVNRVVLGSGSSSATSGVSSQVRSVFVDAYAGRKMDYEEIRDLWSRATSGPFAGLGFLPLPQDPSASQQVLPDMSARDVCRRMLANLANLHSRAASLDHRSSWQVTSMALAAPLGQLCPALGGPSHNHPFQLPGWRLLSEALSPALPPGSNEGRVTALAMEELLLASEEGFVKPESEAGQYDLLTNVMFNSIPGGPPPLSASGLGHAPAHQPSAGQYPIGTLVQYATLPGAPKQPGIVTWWSVARPQDSICYNVLCQPDGCQVTPVPPARLELDQAAGQGQPAEAPGPEVSSTAGHAPPWTSSSCLQTIQGAHQLLRRSWFEAGFADGLASFLKSSGQWLEAPDAWGPGLKHMVSCSKGLGPGFEAVIGDAARQQSFLVPNAFLRYMFPKG